MTTKFKNKSLDEMYPQTLWFTTMMSCPTAKPGVKKCIPWRLKRLKIADTKENNDKILTLFKMKNGEFRPHDIWSTVYTSDLTLGEYVIVKYLTASEYKWYLGNNYGTEGYIWNKTTTLHRIKDTYNPYFALYEVAEANVLNPNYTKIREKIINTKRKNTEFVKQSDKLHNVYNSIRSKNKTFVLKKEYVKSILGDELKALGVRIDQISLDIEK